MVSKLQTQDCTSIVYSGGTDPPCNSHDLYRSESIAINSYLGFTRDIYIDNTLSTVRLPGRLNT